ncbi:hypothetical protein [Dyadobacter subterraneus]
MDTSLSWIKSWHKFLSHRATHSSINQIKPTFMDAMMTLPELRYLSPTTREKAMTIAQELIKTSNISPKDAISKAVLIAKNWAVKNVTRSVWKKLKSIDNEAI